MTLRHSNVVSIVLTAVNPSSIRSAFGRHLALGRTGRAHGTQIAPAASKRRRQMAWFFGATAYAGVLHVDGIPERGPWDARRRILLDEAVVDRMHVAGARARKIRTAAELAGAVRESDGSSAAIRAFMSASRWAKPPGRSGSARNRPRMIERGGLPQGRRAAGLRKLARSHSRGTTHSLGQRCLAPSGGARSAPAADKSLPARTPLPESSDDEAISHRPHR